jgi:hypothetical protein
MNLCFWASNPENENWPCGKAPCSKNDKSRQMNGLLALSQKTQTPIEFKVRRTIVQYKSSYRFALQKMFKLKMRRKKTKY